MSLPFLLQAWVGSPAIYVFDCSAAGLIINSFRAFADQRAQVQTLPTYPFTDPLSPSRSCAPAWGDGVTLDPLMHPAVP